MKIQMTDEEHEALIRALDEYLNGNGFEGTGDEEDLLDGIIRRLDIGPFEETP